MSKIKEIDVYELIKSFELTFEEKRQLLIRLAADLPCDTRSICERIDLLLNK